MVDPEQVTQALSSLEKQLTTKRDEIRKLLDEFEPIVTIMQEAHESLGNAVMSLQQAREDVKDAAATLSQYV